MVKDLWIGEPSVQVHTVALLLYFITQPVNTTDRHVVFWDGGMCPSIFFQVVDTATFALQSSNFPQYILPCCRHSHFLPYKVQTFLSHICGSFL